MKLNFLILAAASLVVAAPATYAQMIAQVPFPFEITGKPMPAGKYDLNYSPGRPYATVRHVATGKTFAFDFRRTSGVRLDGSTLTFLRNGDRYVLTAVSDPRTGGKIELPKDRATKEVAKAQAASVAVTIAE